MVVSEVGLALYGLDTNSLKWYENYLSNRKQIVRIEGVKSSALPVKIGVPQGSIIGPFLFIVYINDLLVYIRNCDSELILYADDTILYCSAASVDDAITRNQIGCTRLEKWCNNNRLTVNTAKTKHMFISSDKDTTGKYVTMYDENLENVCKYNYLGVIIDNKLSFKEFVDDKYKKVNLRVYQLGKIRKYISADTACTIYKQTIVPLLDYCDFMIESSPVTRYNRLENLQERALKYIDNKANI